MVPPAGHVCAPKMSTAAFSIESHEPMGSSQTQAHAHSMAERTKVRHTVQTIHELKRYLRSHKVGENVQRGTSILEMHDLSMSHYKVNRGNVLSRTYDEVGVGSSIGEDGHIYTCEFYRQAPQYLAGETVQHEALPTLLYEGQSDLGAPEVKPTTTKGVPKSKPSVDMISVGSLKNPRRVQEDTFVRFVSVRNYWLFTEDDDDDDCSSTLTREDVRDIIQFCHANTTYPKLRLVSRHFSSSESLLEKQPDPPGWLCAQKRPIVALFKVLMHYYEANTLPDYLFVMDDDSWFRMDLVLPYLLTEHPADEAHVVAGCLIRSQYDWNYTWYWGGFGVILTRRAVQRLLQPIWCDGRASNAFQDHACDQLEQDLLGERSFFTPGMNLVSLMYAYSREQSYLAHKGWNVGYCVHSDMALAYFFNMYHIGVKPKESDLSPLKSAHFDRISAFNGTSVHKTRKVPGKVYKSYGYCLIRNGNLCTTESHLCHYTPEKRMEYLFRQIVEEVPAMYAET